MSGVVDATTVRLSASPRPRFRSWNWRSRGLPADSDVGWSNASRTSGPGGGEKGCIAVSPDARLLARFESRVYDPTTASTLRVAGERIDGEIEIDAVRVSPLATASK